MLSIIIVIVIIIIIHGSVVSFTSQPAGCNLTLALPGQTLLFLLTASVWLIRHAAWKRIQVVLVSGKRAGIIKGFGWPYDGVRCWWLV